MHSTKSIAFSRTWRLGGGVIARFQSDTLFEFSKNDFENLSAHLPGLEECLPSEECAPDLTITHVFSDSGETKLIQTPGEIHITAPWGPAIPDDFVHLFYGAARLEWLKRKIYSMHAACIGNEKDGYVLLVGAPGAGKTSLILNAVQNGEQVFSGDKTLLTFASDGSLEAIAGTHTLTVRAEDALRWTEVPKQNEHRFGGRLVFDLPPERYAASKRVKIKRIFFVDLKDGVEINAKIQPLNALHMLYPFFMDKQREDILIGGSQALLDGGAPERSRELLSKNLEASLGAMPTFKSTGSLQKVTSFIRARSGTATAAGSELAKKKILYGVCGIGGGHYNRQLGVLRHLLAQGHEIMIFAYGEALSYFRERFPQYKNLRVVEVANPYFVGNAEGLDFEQTASNPANSVDFNRINAQAMAQARAYLGKPDLVISDYEMISAQYAYARRAPLVTLDQQSKYLTGDFPQALRGTSYADEEERLSMFFPSAALRIAVSFFNVALTKKDGAPRVEIFPPMIRPEIIAAKDHPQSKRPSLLFYVTSQQLGEQPVDEWIRIIESGLPKDFDAFVFLPRRLSLPENSATVRFYHHGDQSFDEHLIAAHGIITTAGHTLLSEAMFLGKPVYALPLPLYEQQLNAHIIEQGGFGINEPSLTAGKFAEFLKNLETYAANIRNDRHLLIRQPGNHLVIARVLEMLGIAP